MKLLVITAVVVGICVCDQRWNVSLNSYEPPTIIRIESSAQLIVPIDKKRANNVSYAHTVEIIASLYGQMV